MKVLPPLLLSALSVTVSADFLISNTTVCMGAFPFGSCYNGVQVLTGSPSSSSSSSSSVSSSVPDSYTCANLVPAEDNHYIAPGRVGLTSDDDLHADGGICDSGKLRFVKSGPEYIVMRAGDDSNETVGNCVEVRGVEVEGRGGRVKEVGRGNRTCPQLLGSLFFVEAYRCVSSVCG